MNVAIIGTGYVGLPTGVGLAEIGHQVTCIDREVSKIDALQAGKVTLYEAGLDELLHKNFEQGRITFTTSIKQGVEQADIVLIAVGTPPHPVTHEADLQYVYGACVEIAHHLQGYTIIATKSTVPVGTGDVIEKLINKTNPQADFDVVSLPEFLREGYAVHDFFHPARIVIGTNSSRAQSCIKKLYSYFDGKAPLYFVSRRSGETIKYASNSFLAIKIHYINEVADFCEKIGADVLEVAGGMGLDPRIGQSFLNPGPGYGGSCFPKDTMAMLYMAQQNSVDLSLVDAAVKGNQHRMQNIALRLKNFVERLNQSESKIAVLGLAFKDGTDDCRESPAITILSHLLPMLNGLNTKVSAYDAKAIDNARTILGAKINYADSIEECLQNADGLVVLTEWPEFKHLDLAVVKNLMRGTFILDCRNVFDIKSAQQLGFDYHGIGRSIPHTDKSV